MNLGYFIVDTGLLFTVFNSCWINCMKTLICKICEICVSKKKSELFQYALLWVQSELKFWISFTYQCHWFDFGAELPTPRSAGEESLWFFLKVIVVNLGGVGGFREAEKANDRDSCDCLDQSPSALVHRQLCGLTSNRLQLQMFLICLVCSSVYACE